MVLLPIRPYQPALVFAITSPLTIALVRLSFPRSAWERTSGRSASHAQGEPEMTNDDRRHISHLRFSLGDLLLATALVGLALATLLHVLPRIGTIPIIELALAIGKRSSPCSPG